MRMENKKNRRKFHGGTRNLHCQIITENLNNLSKLIVCSINTRLLITYWHEEQRSNQLKTKRWAFNF